MLRRCDYVLIAISVLAAAVFLILAFTVLPERMALSFQEGAEEKSPLLLAVIALLPIISTVLIAIRGFSRLTSAFLEFIIEGYAVLVVLNALGIYVSIPFITLTLLAILCLILSCLLFRGRVNAVPAWITEEKARSKALRLEALMMALLASELLITSLLVLLFSINGAVVILPVMATVVVFLLISSRIK